MIYFDFNFGGLCYLSILNNGLVNFDVKFEGMGFVGFGTRQTPRRWRGVCASITSAPIGAGAALLGLTHDEYVRVQRLERLRDARGECVGAGLIDTRRVFSATRSAQRVPRGRESDGRDASGLACDAAGGRVREIGSGTGAERSHVRESRVEREPRRSAVTIDERCSHPAHVGFGRHRFVAFHAVDADDVGRCDGTRRGVAVVPLGRCACALGCHGRHCIAYSLTQKLITLDCLRLSQIVSWCLGMWAD